MNRQDEPASSPPPRSSSICRRPGRSWRLPLRTIAGFPPPRPQGATRMSVFV